jgi:glycosyltransferase involved in cell wall biosynthesis
MLPILIFAHVPPPHHGQSYMVEQLIEELRAPSSDLRIFHIDSRLSDRLEDVGSAGVGKVWRLVRYCFQAILLCWRHGPMFFYYVPAPAKRGALCRDWLVMALCRMFFRGRVILHWHAVGLGAWIEGKADPLTALLSRWLLGRAMLSLVLAEAVAADATVLRPNKVCVLPNGIPDPCPDFETAVLPARLARSRGNNEMFRILFLAHCTPEKGLYDTLAGVFAAQQLVNGGQRPMALSLTVAGQFLSTGEQAAFQEAAARLAREWDGPGLPPAVECVGFAAGEEKARLFRESDCFCFPTYYPNEVMPVSLIEALAYGLPIVSTRWRAIPEMLPAHGCFLADLHQPAQVAAALQDAMRTESFSLLREHYLAHFQREVFGRRFRAAVRDCFAEVLPSREA